MLEGDLAQPLQIAVVALHVSVIKTGHGPVTERSDAVTPDEIDPL